MRTSLLLIGFAVLALIRPALAADPVTHARLDRSAITYDVHDDLTYVETDELDYTLLTQRGITMRERSAVTFYPNSQTLEVLEAWVDEPDGTRIPVTDSHIFTRPSAASESAPGFVGSLTTTVLYPQLREGSRTHIKWRLVQKTPPMLGFNVWDEAAFLVPTTEDTVDITLPSTLPLHWTKRGGFTVTDTTEAGVRHIRALIAHTPGADNEPQMVDTSDFQPLFLATTLANLEEVGAIYYRQSRDRVVVTPEISALAARIVGDKEGLDAARAVYDWVAANIRYVAVYLDPNDGWVPHAADVVLRNGYGDCKDHVVLMQSLLAARGIEAEAAIIDWGNRTKELPLGEPGQFNHAIVYLPAYDVYANPTNAYATFDALDRRLAGKTVVIASEHGQVSRTPPSRPEANQYRMESRLRILPDGTVEGTATLATSSNLDSGMRSAVASAVSPRDLAERLLSSTPEGGFGIFTTSNPRDLANPLSITATWSSPHGVTFQGHEAYMPVPTGPDLRPPHLFRAYFSSDGERHHAVMVGAGEYTWTTTIDPPPGTTFASVPMNIDLHNGAGRYTATYTRIDNTLRVIRRLVVKKDVYEASEYPDLQALLYAPIDDARAAVVLTREDANASAL